MVIAAYIFDIDGTLADCSDRLHFIQQEKPDWDAFYAACLYDKPIKNVCNLARKLRNTTQLVFLTGRPEKYRKQTIHWLAHYVCNGKIPHVIMREDGDHRPDYVVKEELFHKYIEPDYFPQGIFEDRKQCVDMWRSLGLTCYQVADGNY